MASVTEGGNLNLPTEFRPYLLEIISVWLAGMLAGLIIVFAFIVDTRELNYISTMGEWALAVGLILLALAIPALVLYVEYQDA